MWNNAQAMRRASRWLYVVVFVMLLGSVGVWLYHSSYFPVKQVNINGDLQYTDGEELQNIAARYIRGNVFKAHLNAPQAAFAAMP